MLLSPSRNCFGSLNRERGPVSPAGRADDSIKEADINLGPVRSAPPMIKDYFNKDNLVTVVLVMVGTVAAMLWFGPWIARLINKAKAKTAAA